MIFFIRLVCYFHHYSAADRAPTFADTQHSQVNGAPMFVDTPFRFENTFYHEKVERFPYFRTFSIKRFTYFRTFHKNFRIFVGFALKNFRIFVGFV